MNKKDILVLGKGYLGSTFSDFGYRVLGREHFNYGGEHYNIQFDNIVEKYKPKVIINCLGNADTRLCETAEGWKKCNESNSTLVGFLKYVCFTQGIKLVHISSGCLYDNPGIPQTEEAFTATHCNYAMMKLHGEQWLNKEEDLIIRPRVFFGQKDVPKNLINKLHRFKKVCTTLDSITSVETIVEAVDALIQAEQVGIFNVANTGYISMYQIKQMLYPDDELIGMSSDELREQENLYLVNAVMDLTKLQQFYQPRPVTEELRICFKRLQNERNKIQDS